MIRSSKRNDIGKVNGKYVNLLSQTFEKYKDISILGGRVEENKPEEKEEMNVKVKSSAKYARNNLEEISNLDDKAKKKRPYTNHHQFHKKRQFDPDEDEVIVLTMKSAETKSAGILELSKVLNRTYTSVHQRILKLETGSRKKGKKPFSIEEDFLIIDNSLESLKLCKSLEDTQLENLEDLAKSLKRAQGQKRGSVLDRWKNILKPWLMQYYQKTLNLEIRPMLTSVLAENFNSIHDIDWEWVKKVPEFSGYTVEKLKNVYFKETVWLMAKSLGIERTEMSLQTIAETAKDFQFSKVNKSVIERQQQIIDYFEKKVQSEKIEFAELNLP